MLRACVAASDPQVEAHFYELLQPRLALTFLRIKVGAKIVKGGGEGEEAACGCLYCAEIIPDEPIRLVVSLNSGVFNLQGSIFGATRVQQQQVN